jgi:urease gamma subunit
MAILETIKGKTILAFEVMNTICSGIPSVCISELFPDNTRLIVPVWCLLPSNEES